SSDPARLTALGAAVRTEVMQLPGTRSAVFEALGDETWLAFDADPAALARHDVDADVVESTVALLTTGGQIGETIHDGRRPRGPPPAAAARAAAWRARRRAPRRHRARCPLGRARSREPDRAARLARTPHLGAPASGAALGGGRAVGLCLRRPGRRNRRAGLG